MLLFSRKAESEKTKEVTLAWCEGHGCEGHLDLLGPVYLAAPFLTYFGDQQA